MCKIIYEWDSILWEWMNNPQLYDNLFFNQFQYFC